MAGKPAWRYVRRAIQVAAAVFACTVAVYAGIPFVRGVLVGLVPAIVLGDEKLVKRGVCFCVLLDLVFLILMTLSGAAGMAWDPRSAWNEHMARLPGVVSPGTHTGFSCAPAPLVALGVAVWFGAMVFGWRLATARGAEVRLWHVASVAPALLAGLLAWGLWRSAPKDHWWNPPAGFLAGPRAWMLVYLAFGPVCSLVAVLLFCASLTPRAHDVLPVGGSAGERA